MEQQNILEAKLNRRLKKERWILVAVLLAGLVVGTVFNILYINSREVVQIGDHPLFQYQYVQYHKPYQWGYAIGFSIVIIALAFLVFHLIYCGYIARNTREDVITIVRLMSGIHLYINGEKQDSIVFFGYYLEGKLKDGTKVTVSLSRNAFLAHITFSDGRQSIDA